MFLATACLSTSQSFELRSFFSLNSSNLTQREQEWLVHELTEWLDLPPKMEPQKKRAEKFPPLSDVNISSNRLEP